MPRRREVPKRTILPDPKFGDQAINKFINVLMQDGKNARRARAYGALDTIGSRGASEPLDVFYQALENVGPVVEVKAAGLGATYQVPVEVRPSRRNALAMRWLVDAARKRNEVHDRSASGRVHGRGGQRGGATRKKKRPPYGGS